MLPCHLCNSQDLIDFPEFARLPRVTSDCKAWPSGGRLQLCQGCGSVIKPPDETWLEEIAQIYSGYTIYHQAQGQEQPVIIPETGELTSRSNCILRRLAGVVRLADRGRLLDVGCGNGSFLRSFLGLHPNWTGVGTEYDDKYRTEVESIAGVEGLHCGPLEDLSGRFQALSMIQVLEHMPHPDRFFRTILPKLNNESLVIIALPDHQLNAFDLVVADHCSHFTEASLQRYLCGRGLRPELISSHWIPKERVALCYPGPCSEVAEPDLMATRQGVHKAIEFMSSLIDSARALRNQGTLGIFGTSIAGTWLHAALQGDFDFWVEEDPSRLGRPYLGKPVYRPSEAPCGQVLLAVAPTLAEILLKGFSDLPARFVVPQPRYTSSQ
jgi:SAM-dependent methyltransferase